MAIQSGPILSGQVWELYIAPFFGLAVVSFLPLLIPSIPNLYGQNLPRAFPEDIYFLNIISCAASLVATVPMMLDLAADRQSPWGDLLPRAALIVAQLLPNGLALLLRTAGCSHQYMGLALSCLACVRVNMLRAALMAALPDMRFPPEMSRSMFTWAVISTFGLLMRSYITLPSSFISAIACLVACECFVLRRLGSFEVKRNEKVDNSELLFGFPKVAVLVVLDLFLIFSSLLYPDYTSIFSVIIDAVAATSSFFVVAKDIKLRQISHSNQAFLRYIAHEIRTPLNTSAIGLQLMLQERNASDEEVDTLKASLAAVEEATEILNDLLLADKVDTDKLVLEREEVDAISVVQSTFRSFLVQARSKKIAYDLEAGDGVEGVLISVDKKKYGQVLRNLISNAMKFTPVGGSIRVLLSARDGEGGEGPLLRVGVVDSGVGIKAENLQRLFNEVVQFDAARLQGGGGSGLGLTIAKAIMDAHGGHVGVSSDYGRGSTFYVDVKVCGRQAVKPKKTSPTRPGHFYGLRGNPIVASSNKSSSSSSSSASARLLLRRGATALSTTSSETSSDSSSVSENFSKIKFRRILLVDDSTLNVRMMQKIIRPYATEILLAYDGVMAAEIVQKSLSEGAPIDVILTDYHMPNMDGMELAAHLRMRGYSGLIVLLTGDTSDKLERTFTSQGGNEVLRKPLNVSGIIKLLESCAISSGGQQQY